MFFWDYRVYKSLYLSIYPMMCLPCSVDFGVDGALSELWLSGVEGGGIGDGVGTGLEGAEPSGGSSRVWSKGT